MAGQVDGEQRAPEREGHGVPGVRVLRAPVHEDELGVALPQTRLETVRPGATSTPTRRTSGGPS